MAELVQIFFVDPGADEPEDVVTRLLRHRIYRVRLTNDDATLRSALAAKRIRVQPCSANDVKELLTGLSGGATGIVGTIDPAVRTKIEEVAADHGIPVLDIA